MARRQLEFDRMRLCYSPMHGQVWVLHRECPSDMTQHLQSALQHPRTHSVLRFVDCDLI